MIRELRAKKSQLSVEFFCVLNTNRCFSERSNHPSSHKRQHIKDPTRYSCREHHKRSDPSPLSMPARMLSWLGLLKIGYCSVDNKCPNKRGWYRKQQMPRQRKINDTRFIIRRQLRLFPPVRKKSHVDFKSDNRNRQDNCRTDLYFAMQRIVLPLPHNENTDHHDRDNDEHGNKNHVQHQRCASRQNPLYDFLGQQIERMCDFQNFVHLANYD